MLRAAGPLPRSTAADCGVPHAESLFLLRKITFQLIFPSSRSAGGSYSWRNVRSCVAMGSASGSLSSAAAPAPAAPSDPPPPDRHRAPLYRPDATVLLIGMRGVGKTTLGLIAATSLRRQFLDADSVFKTLHGPISTFVAAHGWPAFRAKEIVVLQQLLKQHPTGFVISCGGGVVESSENRSTLAAFARETGPIVHVVRDENETVQYLVDERARCVSSRPWCLFPRRPPAYGWLTPTSLAGQPGAKRFAQSGLAEDRSMRRSAPTPSRHSPRARNRRRRSSS